MPEIAIDFGRVEESINTVYVPLFRQPEGSPDNSPRKRYMVLVGGAGSGKSVFAAQKIIHRLVSEPGHRIAVFRKVARTLGHSVFDELRKVIERWHLDQLFDINLTDKRLTFRPTGSMAVCLGLDDPEKLKSFEGMTSAWIEEATELVEQDFTQIDLRLRGKTPFYKQIVLTFNPISILSWLKRRFFDTEQGDKTFALRTTYRDNRFLDAEYKGVLERLRSQDINLWRIYGEGQWGELQGLVYLPPEMREFATYPKAYDYTIYGLDFGFNNPTVLIQVGIRDQVHYLHELIYDSGMTQEDLENRLKGIMPLTNRLAPIYYDSEAPDRGEALVRAGWNAIPCHKGKGSVRDGIDYVKTCKLISHPGNVNLNAEFQTYKWAENRDGVTLDEPVKFQDHAMDAIRYALHTHNMIQSGPMLDAWEVPVTAGEFAL